ncbi:unnamed protein product [Ectocarpus sp. 13 AM-2016]
MRPTMSRFMKHGSLSPKSICFVHMFRVFARCFQESLNSWSSAVLLRKPRCWRYVLYKWHEMIRFWSQTLVCWYRVGMLCAHKSTACWDLRPDEPLRVLPHHNASGEQAFDVKGETGDGLSEQRGGECGRAITGFQRASRFALVLCQPQNM